MRKSGGVFWFLVMTLVFGVVFTDNPLLAKGHGKGKGGGHEKKIKKDVL